MKSCFLVVVCLSFVLLAPPATTAETLASPSAGELPPGFNDPIPDWQARWELAKVLSYSKEYAESIAEYRRLLKDRPELLKAKAELAAVLLWSGNATEAHRLAATLPPGLVDPALRLSQVDLHIARQEFDAAGTLLRSHLASHTDDLAARLKLADVLSWSKQYDASIAEFRQILTARPGDVQVRRKLANVLIWADRKAEAAEELRKSLQGR
jgi:thioredoxin-like negative regulator of GroEL